jgi:hypothetical protein
MPRVGKARPQQPKDRLDRCLTALLQTPDAACVGGGEMCCGAACDSAGAELVEALAAFVSHSDAAKRAFVARGGLEGVYALVAKPLRQGGAASRAYGGAPPGSSQWDPDWADEDWGGTASDDIRAMGALAILQRLTASPEGQYMVLQRRPELLRAVRGPRFRRMHACMHACKHAYRRSPSLTEPPAASDNQQQMQQQQLPLIS